MISSSDPILKLPKLSPRSQFKSIFFNNVHLFLPFFIDGFCKGSYCKEAGANLILSPGFFCARIGRSADRT
ncbi:Uncharacterised protein [Mycobacteroides abscessus subsp. abscessus]|nr:Uncharacterised protein [Mycobacteroides abscessus subsp. abscessus]